MMDIDRETVAEEALNFWQQAKQAHWHTVAGQSMWPFLKNGDSIWIEPLESEPKIGDVVLLRFPNRLIVHRVTDVHADGSLTAWGDFNLRADPVAAPQQIVGIARAIRRGQRRISIGKVRGAWGCAVIMLRPLFALPIILIRKVLRLRYRLNKKLQINRGTNAK